MSLDHVEQIINGVARDFHNNGSLSPTVLRRIVELHQLSGAKATAETGCGLTTLILSHLSERHTSFTDGSGDSMPQTREHPLFNATTTNFIVSPTQKSLPYHTFPEPLDLAILDGPHAYPFPDLEYFYFYPNIRVGGILIVDDFHIPTIGHLHDFLCENEMWVHLGDVETTAFFERTAAPLQDPFGDGWPNQRYNRKYFPYPQALEPMFGPGWHKAAFGNELQPPRSHVLMGERIRQQKASAQDEDAAHATQFTAQLEAARSEAEAAQSEARAARRELQLTRAELTAVFESTSWKLTAPLRFLKNALGTSA